MIKEAIGSGNTIDEAKEAALLDLCAADTDDIQFEIISFPKKKTLGLFGGSLAQVRAFVELPDPKPAKNKVNKDKKTTRKTHPSPKRRQQSPIRKKPLLLKPRAFPPVSLPTAAPQKKRLLILKTYSHALAVKVLPLRLPKLTTETKSPSRVMIPALLSVTEVKLLTLCSILHLSLLLKRVADITG